MSVSRAHSATQLLTAACALFACICFECEYRPPLHHRSDVDWPGRPSGAGGSATTGGSSSTGGYAATGGTTSPGGQGGRLLGGAGGLGAEGGTGGGVGAAGGGGTGGGGGTPIVVADFHLPDVNPTSPTYNTLVSPRDYLSQVSAWFFGSAT